MGQGHIYIVLIFLENELATDSISITLRFLGLTCHIWTILKTDQRPSGLLLLLVTDSISVIREFVLSELLLNVVREQLLYRTDLVWASACLLLLLELLLELIMHKIAIAVHLKVVLVHILLCWVELERLNFLIVVQLIVLIAHTEVWMRVMEMEILHRWAACVAIGLECTWGANSCGFRGLTITISWANIRAHLKVGMASHHIWWRLSLFLDESLEVGRFLDSGRNLVTIVMQVIVLQPEFLGTILVVRGPSEAWWNWWHGKRPSVWVILRYFKVLVHLWAIELVVDLHSMNHTVLVLLVVIHGLMRSIRRTLQGSRKATHKSWRMARSLRLELDGLNLLIWQLIWTKAELLVKERLLSICERLIIIHLVICDIFEVFVVETIQNLLITVWLVNDLQTNHWWVLCRPIDEFSFTLELLVDLNCSKRVMLERLVNASLCCSVVFFVFNEFRCILSLEFRTESRSYNLRRLLNLIWIMTLFI